MYLTLWLRPFSMIASIGEKKTARSLAWRFRVGLRLQNLSSDSCRQGIRKREVPEK
jgi:hypothetical protein